METLEGWFYALAITNVLKYYFLVSNVKYDSVTCTLMDTGLQSFNTVLRNSHHRFTNKWFYCSNLLVQQLRELQLITVLSLLCLYVSSRLSLCVVPVYVSVYFS